MKIRLAAPWLLLAVFSTLTACGPSGTPPAEQAAPAAVSPPPAPAPADIVIRGGTLLDMVSDEANPVAIKGIVIRDGRIDRIIAADAADPLPAAVSTIDATGQYILPGLIDSHVHFRPFVADASIWRRASLWYGITTLFDTGPCGEICEATGQDANEWIVEYRELMNNSPDTHGPTLYITGKRIDGPSGNHPLGVKVTGAEEINDYLDQLVALKVDGVKVESTLPADLRAEVIRAASDRGLPVVGHSKDAYESINAGMKFIEHMWPIANSLSDTDPEDPWFSPQHDYMMDMEKAPALIQTMVDQGVYLNPTMVGRYGYFADRLATAPEEDRAAMGFGGIYADLPVVFQEGVMKWWARGDALDDATRATYRNSHAKVEEFIRLFSEAGGRVLAATDAGDDKLVGVSLHREMRMLADAGITPYRVLLGTTRWPAEMTGKADLIGTVEAGKVANITIFGGNPAEEIDHTRDIRYVVSRGLVVRAADDCSTIIPPMAMSCRAEPSL